MLKSSVDSGHVTPSARLNPRITFAVDRAADTESELVARGVHISDPVIAYPEEGFCVGSFLDSEGNKIWYCSPIEPDPDGDD